MEVIRTMQSNPTDKKILFVDDELQILKSLKRLFMDTDYEIFTADSGNAALAILANEKIDLVITDMRMPIMDGFELLQKIQEAHPHVLRIILSGYSEKTTILNALQKNLAKLYIMKPWDNSLLLKVVNQIFETDSILCDDNLIHLIHNTDDLPTLKTSYHQIMNLIDESADLGKIANAIAKDPAIATKILHIINSAFYEVKTGNIKQAIALLGLSTTRNIVLATSIVDSFTMQGLYKARLEMIWNHAFICSQILNIIYKNFLDKKLSEIESSAGLLHNIGMALFFKIFPEKYIEIFRRIEKDKDKGDLLAMEWDSLNVTHQQAGAYLLKWWEIPYPIVEAALYHHTPFATGIINHELIYAVNIAQHYANTFVGNQLADTFDPSVFNALGIQQSQLEEELLLLKRNPL
jgi:HD-like signal output (HDOD) protein/ActR/RegA family two-component response regulator